jgi:hypothetical protein
VTARGPRQARIRVLLPYNPAIMSSGRHHTYIGHNIPVNPIDPINPINPINRLSRVST